MFICVCDLSQARCECISTTRGEWHESKNKNSWPLCSSRAVRQCQPGAAAAATAAPRRWARLGAGWPTPHGATKSPLPGSQAVKGTEHSLCRDSDETGESAPWPSPLLLKMDWKCGYHTSRNHSILSGIFRKERFSVTKSYQAVPTHRNLYFSLLKKINWENTGRLKNSISYS